MYMRSDPEHYFSNDVEACCRAHFIWNLVECQRNSSGPPKWYPEFDLAEGGCKNDGLEPLHMKTYDDYLFGDQLSCCEAYFPWNVGGCMEQNTIYASIVQDPCSTSAEVEENEELSREIGYYPKYSSDNEYCVDDGQPPPYMLAHPDGWFHQSLAECCLANFQWVFRECMGDKYGITAEGGGNPCPSAIKLSGKWYVEYYSEDDHRCVQECEGDHPCGGLAQSYMELYDSFEECCKVHLWWMEDSPCRGNFGGL